MRRHRHSTLAIPSPYRGRAAVAATVLILCGLGGSAYAADSPSPSGTASGARSGSWTVYHGDPAGTGVATSVTSVDTASPAWTSPALDGQLYGEPLVYAGRVFVATENDTVYALSAATGTVAWSAHLGTPVPSGSLPCGDITPTAGITGTPVIDPARNEIFVVADEMAGGNPAHRLFGLSTATGRVEMSQDVDPPGAVPADLLQRTGLTLDAGRVVFGLGGNYGDCAVLPRPGGGGPRGGRDAESLHRRRRIRREPGRGLDGRRGPGGRRRGDVWVSAGNGSVTRISTPTTTVTRCSSCRRRCGCCSTSRRSTWATNNSQDLDMSTAPALLPDGQVVLAGKSRIVYLLNGCALGGIGGQQATLGARSPPRDRPAATTSTAASPWRARPSTCPA